MGIELSQETRSAMDKVVANASTKSDKIRALGRAQFKRADIARYLNIRYQFVRNVLEQAKGSVSKAEREASETAGPLQQWVQVGRDGSMVIPAPFRKFLGIENGGPVFLVSENGEVHLLGRDAAIRRVQELVAPYLPKNSSLVDELIAERRAEAARESGK